MAGTGRFAYGIHATHSHHRIGGNTNLCISGLMTGAVRRCMGGVSPCVCRISSHHMSGIAFCLMLSSRNLLLHPAQISVQLFSRLINLVIQLGEQQGNSNSCGKDNPKNGSLF